MDKPTYKISHFIGTLLIVTSILVSSDALAQKRIDVKVGGYNFPPFVEKDGKAGIVKNLIDKFNKVQDKYKFVFVSTSPARRYRDLKSRNYDVIFFEDEAWSWETSGVPYAKTGILAKGGENFVSLKRDSRNQTYFDSFKDKKIRVIFGYHYNFANMKTDPEILRKDGISLGQTEEENLKDLLSGRIDIIVMNSFFIERLFQQDKSLKDKLLVSVKKDQNYSLRAFLHTKSPISAEEIEKIFLANIK